MDKLKFNSDNVPDKKISTTLWEFALPLINRINEHATKAQIEKGMITLVTIWNATVQDKLNDDNNYIDILRQTMERGAWGQVLSRGLGHSKFNGWLYPQITWSRPPLPGATRLPRL